MSFEELGGISKEEQWEIRARAVHGAVNDAIGGILPIADELRSDKAHRRLENQIADIMERQNVSEEEARIILTEQILLERNRGE